MKRITWFVLAFVLFLSIADRAHPQGTGTDATGDERSALITNSKKAPAGAVYTNEEFGLSFSIPEGWLILPSDVSELSKKKGKELYEDNSAAERKQIDEALARTTMVFSAMEPPAPGRPSSVLMSVVEYIPEGSHLSIRSYYEALINAIRMSNKATVDVLEPLATKKVGNQLCGFFAISIEVETGFYIQRYIVFVKGREAILVAMSIAGESGQAAYDAVSKSVKIK